MNLRTMPNRRWILPAVVGASTIMLSGCGAISRAGTKAGRPFDWLGEFAVWSFGWFIPALLLREGISSDHSETQSASGTGHTPSGTPVRVTVHVPTGRVIKGDPEMGHFVLLLWLTAYPIGYFYFPTWRARKVAVTGLPNLDWTLITIAIPALTLLGIGTAIRVVTTSSSAFCRLLVRLWQIAIGLGALNLLIWLSIIIVQWMLARPSDRAAQSPPRAAERSIDSRPLSDQWRDWSKAPVYSQSIVGTTSALAVVVRKELARLKSDGIPAPNRDLSHLDLISSPEGQARSDKFDRDMSDVFFDAAEAQRRYDRLIEDLEAIEQARIGHGRRG